MLRDLILPFEIVSLLISLLMYRRKEIPQYLRFFPIFLFITCIVEAIGSTTRDKSMVAMPMYNCFMVFEFLFYFYVLYSVVSNRKVRQAIMVAVVSYPIIAILFFLSRSMYSFHSTTFMLGAALMVCFCIYHLYELFNVPDFKATIKSPDFWLCCGLLTFYAGIWPLFGAWNWVLTDTFSRHVADVMLTVLNCILYSAFITAFFCFLKAPTSKALAAIP